MRRSDNDAAGFARGPRAFDAFVVSARRSPRVVPLPPPVVIYCAELNATIELLPAYLERAAAWCERHGGPSEAFAYAHERGDLAQAGRSRSRTGTSSQAAGRSRAGLWLDRCTNEEIESDPQLSIAAAWGLCCLAIRSGEAVLAAAGRKPLDSPSADGATRFVPHSRPPISRGSRRDPRRCCGRRARLRRGEAESTHVAFGACRALGDGERSPGPTAGGHRRVR